MNKYCSLQKCAVELDEPKSSQHQSTSSPLVFGPPTWAYLHISTAHLPENLNPIIATQVRNTLYALPLMVPCDACSLHSGNFMTENKARLDSLKTGSEFFKFTVDLHNFVNKRLGKRVVGYDEARATWG